MVEIRRIGILTSGGDCAGLNPVIRAAVCHAIDNYGWEVWGICNATLGLIADPPHYLNLTVELVDEAIKNYRAVSPEDTLIHTARGLGICLGD